MIVKEKKQKGHEIEVKRLYLPFVLMDSCPHCGTDAVMDLEDDYLSFPELGNPESVHFYCGDCDHEWSNEVILTMNLKPA